MSGRRIVRPLAAAALLAAAAVAAAGPDLEDALWDLQIVTLGPQAAPALALDDLTGARVTLEGLRGRAVLLYFWESG